MILEKGVNSYITVEEAIELLELEKPEEVESFKKLDGKKQEYSLIKATSKIESLNIKGEEGLKFPLPYQKIVPFEVELCCVLEALYIATGKITEELEVFKKGIVSESNKTASVTYNTTLINKYKDIVFNNLEAYKLIERYVSNSYQIR